MDAVAKDGIRTIFVVSMDVEPDMQDIFNEVYDTEHLPYMLEVPGFLSAARYERVDEGPRYMAVYELEAPSVLESAAYKEARDKGRWPTEIRPHTYNRSHAVYMRRAIS